MYYYGNSYGYGSNGCGCQGQYYPNYGGYYGYNGGYSNGYAIILVLFILLIIIIGARNWNNI